MASSPVSRRSFLAASGAAAGAAMILNKAAFGANDRISIGLIGTGSRCHSLTGQIAELQESHNVTVTGRRVRRNGASTAWARLAAWQNSSGNSPSPLPDSRKCSNGKTWMPS